MILFPSRDEVIVSKMSPDEICEALSAITIPPGEYRFWKKKPEFVGKVSTAGFELVHPEKKYNIQLSALPVVTGNYTGLMLCCGQWAFRSLFYLSARNTMEKMRKLFGKDD